MSRVLPVILILIGGGAIASGGYVAAYPAPARVDIDYLQQVATTACLCERHPGPDGRQGCWSRLDRLMPPKESGTMATACMPVSMEGRCRENEDSGDPMGLGECVVLWHSYGRHHLCSAREVSAVETLWNKETAGQTGELHTPLADRLADDIVAGRAFTPIPGPGGCGAD